MARRRLVVREAADALGVSVDAVRSRIKRGTLESEKGEDGRVFVWLDADQGAAKSQAEVEGSRELVEELRDRVRSLEEQLGRADERDRENRRIIAALTARIPEIEAPSETPGAPTGATEQPGRVEPQRSVEAADEAERAGRAPSDSAMGGGRIHRSWWRRMFGG